MQGPTKPPLAGGLIRFPILRDKTPRVASARSRGRRGAAPPRGRGQGARRRARRALYLRMRLVSRAEVLTDPGPILGAGGSGAGDGCCGLVGMVPLIQDA